MNTTTTTKTPTENLIQVLTENAASTLEHAGNVMWEEYVRVTHYAEQVTGKARAELLAQANKAHAAATALFAAEADVKNIA